MKKTARLVLVSAVAGLGVASIWPLLGWATPVHHAHSAVTAITGGAVTNVRGVVSVVRERGSVTHSTSFTTLPGPRTTISVPAGHRAFLLIRFSGQAWCQGVSPHNCSIVVLVDGTEAAPLGGGNSHFASVNPSPENDESRSIERVSQRLDAGKHAVSVMWRTSNSGVDFRMFLWTLVVEQVRIF